MRQILLCFWLTLQMCQICLAQHEATIWFFGRNAGISFNQLQPVALGNGAMNTLEGCTSVADSSGNLLFYTNGVTVWNRAHQVMAEGIGLMGHVSATQGVGVVPLSIPDQYLIFTLGERGSPAGLRMSLIDMSQDNGNGRVLQRNILVEPEMAEKMVVTRHPDQQSHWLICRKANSNRFYSFRVASNGSVGPPIISAAGTVDSSSTSGQMKISLDGQHLALAIRDAKRYELYRFNPQTGTVTYRFAFSKSFNNCYGLEFSPDGQKLFLHSSSSPAVDGQPEKPSLLFQANLAAGSDIDIDGSLTLLDTIRVPNPGAMQLGPDGRIYLARPEQGFLGAVRFPNRQGKAADYQDEGLFLGGRKSRFGLPNYDPQAVMPIPQPSIANTCLGDSTELSLSHFRGIDSVSWDLRFGGLAKKWHRPSSFNVSFPQAVDFPVRIVLARGQRRDTLQVSLQITAPPSISLGNDTSLCKDDLIRLQVPSAAVNYFWQDGSFGRTFMVQDTGWYWVEAANQCGTVRDSIRIDWEKPPIFSLGSDTALCTGEVAQLKGPEGLLQYQWNTGHLHPSIWVNQPGTYSLKVSNACFSWRDTIEVAFVAPPEFDLGLDTFLCSGTTLELSGGTRSPVLRWQNGALGTNLLISEAGWYWAEASNGVCTIRDSVHIMNREVPSVKLGTDFLLCEGTSTWLSPGEFPNANFTWQDGSTTPVFEVSQAGRYSVTIENECGLDSGFISVAYTRAPAPVELGSDTLICEDLPIELDITQELEGITYTWDNLSSTPTRDIFRPGRYFVEVSTQCGSSRDTILVSTSEAACQCLVMVPNLFSPNNDGVNDEFKVSHPCFLSRFRLSIYDRYGGLLFHSRNPDVGWDGNTLNGLSPEGVYYWVLDYQAQNGVEQEQNVLKGFVTLLR
ncbi:MAG: gliding motility-associated C-terminal domain-containing protein [Bacteroidota bacterium]